MTMAKQKAAMKRAGELAFRMVRHAQNELAEARESMHWSHHRYGGLHGCWRNDYRAAKYAANELRAARILYDKLPRYAK